LPTNRKLSATISVRKSATTLLTGPGHTIPVAIDWQHIKTSLATSKDAEETHNIVVWLAKHALDIVMDTDGGLGELIKVLINVLKIFLNKKRILSQNK
jgi:hypothetical protein